jgi:hypothetical protein
VRSSVLVAAIAAALAGSVLAASPARSADASPTWQSLGDGLEHLALAKGPLEGHAFRFEIADVELRLVPAPRGRARVADLAPQGNVVAVNASFFDTDGRAMGLAIDRGRSIGGARIGAWGALVVSRGSSRIVRGSELARDTDADLVVQGLPRLLIQGVVPSLKPQPATRTAVCAEGSRLVLVATTTRVAAADLARFLASAPEEGGLGCRNALNLDGGPSTQLEARWNGFAASVAGGWGVPNALVLMPRTRRALSGDPVVATRPIAGSRE